MKMKTTIITLSAFCLVAHSAFAEGTNAFKNNNEKTSYAIGLNIGNSWKQQEIDADYEFLVRGIKDAKAGGPTLLNEAETGEVLNKFRQDLMAKQQQKLEKIKAEGDAFLAANKDKPGVISLPSGLQYKILTEGKGPSPKPEDIVEVNYRGTLIDGTEFDSSAKAGKPATFAANGVIRGWTEALTRMNAGAKWQLFIPSELGYGPQGRRPKITPNAALLFDVELVSFQAPPPPPTNAPALPSQPLTSDIIKVPSLEEMKKGAKIETIKAEDVDKLQKKAAEKPPEKP